MAGNRYEIDYNPGQSSPAVNLLVSVLQANKKAKIDAENAETQRKFAERNLAISSANEEREKWKTRNAYDEQQRTHAIERSKQLDPLSRVARRSVGMANEMGQPYGIGFSEGTNPDAHVQNPYAGNDFAAHAKDAMGTSLIAPTEEPSLGADENGSPYEGPLEAPPPQAAPMMGPANEDPVQAESQRLASIKRPIMATIAGRSFQVPEQSSSTGLGPEYDQLYDQVSQMPGVTPEHAMQWVMTEHQKRAAEAGKDQRLQDALGGRDKSREQHEAFLQEMAKKYHLTAEEQAQLRREGFSAQRAAAGAAPVSTAVPELIRMTEEGAPASEVYQVAADKKVPQKQFATATQNVVKNAAAGERAGLKREALVATDDTGKEIGTWKDANSAKTGAAQIERFHRVKERLEDLIADVARTGSRVLSPDDIQQRLSKAAGVVAALRPFNELSNTAAGQKAEELIAGAMGAPGHGFLLGANADILKRLLTEAEGQHRAQLGTKLRPGGGSQLAPALGGPRRGAQQPQGNASHPSQATVGETRQGPDGRTYKKVGPNNWQPVDQ